MTEMTVDPFGIRRRAELEKRVRDLEARIGAVLARHGKLCGNPDDDCGCKCGHPHHPCPTVNDLKGDDLKPHPLDNDFGDERSGYEL